MRALSFRSFPSYSHEGLISGSLSMTKLLKPSQNPSSDHQHFAIEPNILLQIQLCFENIAWKCCYDMFKTSVFSQLLLSIIRSSISQFRHPGRKHQKPCAFGRQMYSENHPLSISQCSPETLHARAREKQPKAKWAEGFIHSLYSPNSQIPLAATSSVTCHKKGVKWGNHRMCLMPSEPLSPSLAPLLKSFCHMWLLWTGDFPLRGTDRRVWWQSAMHGRSNYSLPAAPLGHRQFYMLTLWCLHPQFSCSHRTLRKQIM